MTATFQAQLTKLSLRPAIWIVAALWMVLSLVFGYVFPYLSYRGSPSGPDAALGAQVISEALPAEVVPSAIQGFPLFAGALALLIGVLALGSEYSWNTVKVLFTTGPRRESVLVGQSLALVTVMLVVVLATFTVDSLASLLVASLTDKPADWPSIGAVLTGIGGGWLVVSMWCLAGAFLGTAVRGTALAVGIGLV
jgi:ABC-type transport system involved in multi-copper enzyme maturation permease subunit